MKRMALVGMTLLLAAWLAGCAARVATHPLASEGVVGVPAPPATATDTAQPSPTPTLDLPIAPEVGALAPDFTLPALDGTEVSLRDYRGQLVLLNFWTTWWPYCRAERAALQKAHDDHDDLVVLTVSLAEAPSVVQPFVERLGLTLPALVDEKAAVGRVYRVMGIPATFFIDRAGVIREQHIGPISAQIIAGYLEQWR